MTITFRHQSVTLFSSKNNKTLENKAGTGHQQSGPAFVEIILSDFPPNAAMFGGLDLVSELHHSLYLALYGGLVDKREKKKTGCGFARRMGSS